MDTKKLSFSLAAIIIFFTLYCFAVYAKSVFWANVIAVPTDIMLFILIFLGVRYSKYKTSKLSWLFISLSVFFWGIADLIWAVYDIFFKIDPNESTSLFYSSANFLILIGLIFYGLHEIKKWSIIQLIVDSFANTSAVSFLLWVLFLHRNFELTHKLSQEPIALFCIVIDILIVTGISTWFFSVRNGKLPPASNLGGVGILIFAANDLFYYYKYFSHSYIPNDTIDIIYIVSFIFIACGACCKKYCPESRAQSELISNIGFKNKGLFMLIYPILLIILGGFQRFFIWDFVIFSSIISIHMALTFYVQTAIKNEHLLRKEKELTTILEQQVCERTRQLIQKNQELDTLSNQDTITNVYNRRYFINALDKMMQGAGISDNIAVFYIDLDRFKIINDTYGHYVGDNLLVELANRLKNCCGEDFTLARLGGDEFVIAVRKPFEREYITGFAEKLLNVCRNTFYIDQYVFNITISIGISVYPFDAKNRDELMKNADIAMYQAKEKGRNTYEIFNNEISRKIQRKHEIEFLLRKADFNKEFEMYYQPQISIPEKKLVGMEALIRWKNPKIGFVPPSEFIPIAEEIGYIELIGNWTMRQAVAQIAEWNRKYNADLKMGINISPIQFENRHFINFLNALIEDYQIPPHWIDIEITENVVMVGDEKLLEIFDELTQNNVSISLDDFGTGYSSLGYLKQFPFYRIKIAKTLIDEIHIDNYDTQIVKAIIALAKAIGIKTIAEGVEYQSQLDVLADLGCEEIQGYFFSKPLPASEFEEKYFKQHYKTGE
ncbi:MAG: bifunctional diguanylate cyclase/phosphodiesterase [Clostridia bacterium]|nr:bifunctional diguanylate cyclase/phosphodiesterase [Clostridia bacterium]